MKNTYLNNFKKKTKDELLYIVDNAASYNSYAVEAAHELLRKKTATFTEYQELTSGRTSFKEASRKLDKVAQKKKEESALSGFLTILKWIGIILFFPLSLVVVGYYRNKKAKAAYYANNRPHSER